MMWLGLSSLVVLIIAVENAIASVVGLSYLWYRVLKMKRGSDLPTCARWLCQSCLYCCGAAVAVILICGQVIFSESDVCSLTRSTLEPPPSEPQWGCRPADKYVVAKSGRFDPPEHIPNIYSKLFKLYLDRCRTFPNMTNA